MVLASCAAYVAHAFSPPYSTIGTTQSNTARRLLHDPAVDLPEYDETCIPGPRWHCPKKYGDLLTNRDHSISLHDGNDAYESRAKGD